VADNVPGVVLCGMLVSCIIRDVNHRTREQTGVDITRDAHTRSSTTTAVTIDRHHYESTAWTAWQCKTLPMIQYHCLGWLFCQ